MVERLAAVIATHDPLHDLAALEVTEWPDKSVIRRVPLVPPATKCHQNVEQILAFLGQEVFMTRRSILIGASVEDPGLDQSRKAVGEDVAGDTEVSLKIVKPLDP